MLPLVEFFLEEGVTDDEAVQLIESAPRKKDKQAASETRTANMQSLRMDDLSAFEEAENGDISADPFTASMMSFEV